MPQYSDLHIDRPLTNFAVEYQNDGLIAPQVAPFVPVNNKSDTYITFTKADKFSLPEDVIGPKGEANEVTWSTGTGEYNCINRGLRDFLPDDMVANSDPAMNPYERTTAFLVDLLLNNWEKRVADLVMTYGNYATSGLRVTLAGATQLSDYTNSDPIGVVDTARDACFVEPNTMIMGVEVFNKLKRHPQLIDLVKGGSTSGDPAQVNLQQMKEIFEIPNILIGRRRYNSAMKGQTAIYERLWGKHIVVAYVDPSVSLQSLSAWKTFRWNQVSTGAGWQVRRFREEKKGIQGGWYIQPVMSITEKAICTDLAYMIKDAVA